MTNRTQTQRMERRRLARELHPDHGGDAESFIAAMAALDRRQVVPFAVAPSVRSSSSRTGAWAFALRRAARAGRARLPRGWPGARRYARL